MADDNCRWGFVRRSLGLQAALLIIGITALTLGASALVNDHFDKASMRQSLEGQAKEVSGLLRVVIDKPMIIGDDKGTSAEFAFLADKFPGVDISIASFTGNVTYSTTPGDIRQDISRMFKDAMSAGDRAVFEDNYNSALKGQEPDGKLLVMGGRSKFLHVSPIFNERNCHHCHGASQPVLGAMAVVQDVQPAIADAANRTIRGILFSLAGGVLLILFIILFIRRRIIRRLGSVAATSQHILDGNYNARFTVSGADELGRVAGNLGAMLQSLKTLGVAQSVLKGLSIPSAMCDVEGRLTYVNQALLDLLGETRSPDALMGERADVLLYGRENSPESIFGSTLSSRTTQLGKEQAIAAKSGAALQVRLDANPVYDLEGTLIGAFASLTDLTAIRRNEAAILKNNATINSAAGEAGALTREIGRATNALAEQIEATRRQAARQQQLSDATVSELEEVNQAMAEVARNASQVAGHAGDTKQSAVQGSQQAALVNKSMEGIVSSVSRLKEQMEDLGRRTEGIGQIMQVIQDIADQTNLLALNAAIEAARAGDAGRGFAVVADEVRKLAEKTMESTVAVGRTVTEIKESAGASIKAVEEAGDTVAHSTEQVSLTAEVLERILHLAESVAGEVQAIAAAAEQQSSSVDVVRSSIQDIKDISEEAAEATRETETAVRSLMDIAGSLDRIVVGMTDKETK